MPEDELNNWINAERKQIITIYKMVCSEKCPGLRAGAEYRKTNREMLVAIEKFVRERVEPIS